MINKKDTLAITALLLFISNCSAVKTDTKATTEQLPQVNITERILHNQIAYIPPQCYTKTEDNQGNIHNPCFACHTTPLRPNFINDSDLQLRYSLADTARINPWQNLFKERSAAIEKISDQEITDYIRQSNYFDSEGKIKLAEKLKKVPVSWDYDHNGQWNGFIPDIWFNFDSEGFDYDNAGKLTGWRAFAYYPYLGTFWPTNGSTDDVMIRLPKSFRTNTEGNLDLTVYKVNLAIVEAMLKEHDVMIEPVDEAVLGSVDLNKDGKVGMASKIHYDWAPLEERYMWYVGQANAQQQAGEVHLAAGLYPEGTEFIHTVRYIETDEQGNNLLSQRMKEVRYAVKRFWMNYSKLEYKAFAEVKEKNDFPNRLKTIRGNVEAGVSNGQGWSYAAFIEDAQGELRPQNYEELVFCAGCHSGIGTTRDGIFSFHRKLATDNKQQGWYHWSQQGLKGIADPMRSDGQYEYSHYLQQNKSANEFRTNQEAQEKFFDANKQLKPDMLEKLHQDISTLLFASKLRALNLNKAYRVIVQEQSFSLGRDAIIEPVENVHKELEEDKATGIKEPVFNSPLIEKPGLSIIKGNMDLFLPSLTYKQQNYWAELTRSNSATNEWVLTAYDTNSLQSNKGAIASMNEQLDISIPLITDGQVNYAAELAYSGWREGQLYWTLKAYAMIGE